MKTSALQLLPLGLLPIVLGLLLFFPATAGWADSALFLNLPYLSLGLAALLGLVFTQSRVAYVAALMAAAAFLTGRAFFVMHDAARCRATALLSSVLVPSLTALFFRLNERGVWTGHGARRAIGVGFVAAVLWCVPMLPFLKAAVASPASLLRPLSPAVRVPAVGLLAVAASIPFLFLKQAHESARLGGLLGLAAVFCLAGLGFDSSLWGPAQGRTALALFMCAAGVTLAGAVLESAWRHANVDDLTDLAGRRSLKHSLRCLGDDYAVAILDLDRFKRINDRYGHDVGDQVLKLIAAQLQRLPWGTAYRYGGEEFAVVAKNKDFGEFVAELDALRDRISRREFLLREPDRPSRKPKQPPRRTGRKPQTILVTVSIGAACRNRRYATPQAAMEAADRALYRAKESGRNQVCRAG